MVQYLKIKKIVKGSTASSFFSSFLFSSSSSTPFSFSTSSSFAPPSLLSPHFLLPPLFLLVLFLLFLFSSFSSSSFPSSSSFSSFHRNLFFPPPSPNINFVNSGFNLISFQILDVISVLLRQIFFGVNNRVVRLVLSN